MHAASLIADRFVANGASWIDLASGHAVRLRVAAGGERDDQLRWSDARAAHARLRHPLLNPLLDYGALDRYRLFEAYAALPPLPASSAATQRLLTQTMGFLRAHHLELTADHAAYAVRSSAPAGSSRLGRALGIVLQSRPAIAALDDVLDAAGPGGPCLVTVCGAPGAGLRTLRVLVARAARLHGYVPLSPPVIVARPWLADAVLERHVCLLVDPPQVAAQREALASLLARLGRASARRHVVIVFERTATSGWSVIPIGSMGVSAMTSMVFVDANGPSPADLFEAARRAGGNPGRFLDHLGACAFETHTSRTLVAHEALQPYRISTEVSGRAGTPSSPAAGVLSRAVARADDLARRGRHLAATRLLARASRVLAGRGDANDAARCAERLARLHMDRGRAPAAHEQFERARSLATDPRLGRAATLGIAAAWIDEGRLAEAEALLRSMAVSAVIEAREDAAVACALARCLYWQGRYAEAAVALQPHLGDTPDAICLAVGATVRLAEGAVTAGVQLARRAAATMLPAAPGDVRTVIHRALAATLSAAGDDAAAREHAIASIAAARHAHLPLAVIRARITQIDILARSAADPVRTRRLAERLLALGKPSTLPLLLRFELQKSIGPLLGTPPGGCVAALEQQGSVRWPSLPPADGGRNSTITELESLLEVCHAAPDERQALDRLCAAALERIRASSVVIVAAPDRRVGGQSGRPWDGASAVVDRTLTSGAASTPLERSSEPLLAAAPVKFAGEVIGAIAGRWIPGSAIDADRYGSALKTAALAAAAPLRALLDRRVPEVAGQAWSDLLGDSPECVAVREAAARAARAPYPVLIEGESGSGKELVARAIHRLSVRRERRFCAVNCAALSDELLEAELFGHARGAFTGAVGERAGLFEEADGGTLLLDEVGELSPRAQAKLLRVIQEGEIRRVGESFSRRVDVRIVAATNRRLEQEAAAGRFRADLRFRLDVIRIAIPALRERAADIPLLAAHFWNDAARRVGSRATLSPDALAALARYDWPGNVRELQNAIAWIAVHSPRRGRIGADALPAGIAGSLSTAAVTFETAREEFERRFIRSALARANGRRSSAAESLGITRQGLAKMIRRLRIDERPFV